MGPQVSSTCLVFFLLSAFVGPLENSLLEPASAVENLLSRHPPPKMLSFGRHGAEYLVQVYQITEIFIFLTYF